MRWIKFRREFRPTPPALVARFALNGDIAGG